MMTAADPETLHAEIRRLRSALRARDRHDGHQPVLVELVLDLRQPVLGQHEGDLDGLDLGDAHQRLGGRAGAGGVRG